MACLRFHNSRIFHTGSCTNTLNDFKDLIFQSKLHSLWDIAPTSPYHSLRGDPSLLVACLRNCNLSCKDIWILNLKTYFLKICSFLSRNCFLCLDYNFDNWIDNLLCIWRKIRRCNPNTPSGLSKLESIFCTWTFLLCLDRPQGFLGPINLLNFI